MRGRKYVTVPIAALAAGVFVTGFGATAHAAEAPLPDPGTGMPAAGQAVPDAPPTVLNGLLLALRALLDGLLTVDLPPAPAVPAPAVVPVPADGAVPGNAVVPAGTAVPSDTADPADTAVPADAVPVVPAGRRRGGLSPTARAVPRPTPEQVLPRRFRGQPVLEGPEGGVEEVPQLGPVLDQPPLVRGECHSEARVPDRARKQVVG
jgi:hypothetical protein